MVRGIISHGVIVMTSRDLVSKIRRYSAKNFSCQVLLGNSKFSKIGDHFGCVPIIRIMVFGAYIGPQRDRGRGSKRDSQRCQAVPLWNPASWHQRNTNLSL